MLNKNTVSAIVLVLLFSALNAPAAEITVDELINRMQESEDRIKDLKFDFVQEIEFKTVKEKHRLEGKLVYKQPGKIVYNQLKPQEQLIVSDGSTMWIYNPRTKQVYIDKWKNWKGIDYFLPGIFQKKGRMSDLKKAFNFDLQESDEKNYILHFITRKDKKGIKFLPGKFEFYLWVDKTTLLPARSKFLSKDVDCVTEISAWEKNLGTTDDIFRFKIPEGVEVFKQ